MRFNNKNVELPVLSRKFVKITDWTSLQDGDEFIFVNESTGQVITTCFNMGIKPSTTASNQAPMLSDETITISNGEFDETELDKIKHTTYHSTASSLYTYDALPLIIKKSVIDSTNDYYMLIYNTDYALVLTSTTANRKMKLISPVPSTPTTSQKWRIYTENNKQNMQVLASTTSTAYGSLKGAGNDYGTLWLGNYRTSFSGTWTPVIYKKV